jgi:transcriptional regulator with XRE-family HTH domain
VIELARPLPRSDDRSPFPAARIARQWTVAEAAQRAGLPEEHIEWLEEGRVYRFASPNAALAAAVLYASALGIDNREARTLAGLPVPPRVLERSARGRVAVLAGVAAAVAVLAAGIAVPVVLTGGESESAGAAPGEQAPVMPQPWEISVDVLNGSGDINWTRQVASRIGALAYTIAHVGKADRFDYQQTAVYYEVGGEAAAIRLARQLGVVTRPLPGGSDARRLVVVVGPRKGPGQ